MKHLVLIIGLLIPQLAQARIGETREQCDKRYGKILSSEAGAIPGETIVGYEKSGYFLNVTLFHNICHSIFYAKTNREKISVEEAKIIMAKHADGFVLYDVGYGRKYYIAKTDKFGGIFANLNELERVPNLIVSTGESLDRSGEKTRLEAEKSTDGL